MEDFGSKFIDNILCPQNQGEILLEGLTYTKFGKKRVKYLNFIVHTNRKIVEANTKKIYIVFN